MTVESGIQIKVADEVWIATALLHREHPRRTAFSVEEIVNRAAQEGLVQPQRPGVYVHAVQHCVANRPPNPGRYRMLFETSEGQRRLYRQGDAYHPARDGAKIKPSIEDLPDRYRELIDWYDKWSETNFRKASDHDPLLALAGSGRELWRSEHADEYVKRLREGW
ncbi:MAG TPA: hypothetical protein VMU28_01110 [Terriglobales bacterium]|nr:hypothetical protein [Terriglobales bacterium]